MADREDLRGRGTPSNLLQAPMASTRSAIETDQTTYLVDPVMPSDAISQSSIEDTGSDGDYDPAADSDVASTSTLDVKDDATSEPQQVYKPSRIPVIHFRAYNRFGVFGLHHVFVDSCTDGPVYSVWGPTDRDGRQLVEVQDIIQDGSAPNDLPFGATWVAELAPLSVPAIHNVNQNLRSAAGLGPVLDEDARIKVMHKWFVMAKAAYEEDGEPEFMDVEKYDREHPDD